MTIRERAEKLCDALGLENHYSAVEFTQSIEAALLAVVEECARIAREYPWDHPSIHADPVRQARCRGNREASIDIADAIRREMT